MALPSINHLLTEQQQQLKRRDWNFGDMDFTSLLNHANQPVAVIGGRNMQYEVAMPVNMSHDMSGTQHYANQNNLYVPNGATRIKSESGSDRGASPHTSDQASRYPSQTPSYAAMAVQLSNGMRYASPATNTHPQPGGVGLMGNPYAQTQDQQYPQQQQASLGAVQTPTQQAQSPMDTGRASTGSSGLPKAFACSTCAKGFARRSDLARHERIHSGVRPHVCEFAGCGKQFIQRSALTVHSRVHTGEKPHMCERCGKPFSDSSSLARHRRIHSGKRPYKCPYADCQKTFTRRTTLTRHQNHHTGTIEESVTATAAALASRQALNPARSRASDEGDGYSTDSKSSMHQAPDNRPSSDSPGSGMSGVPIMPRPPHDYYINAMHAGMAAVPAHIRSEMQSTSRPQSPAQYQIPVTTQQPRPGLTSNPSSGYTHAPQIVEPPTANGQPQAATTAGSPHMGAQLGWQQAPHGLPTAPPNDYAYADPNHGYANVNTTQMYYQHSQPQPQRPHNNGPMDYTPMRGQEMWAQHQQ